MNDQNTKLIAGAVAVGALIALVLDRSGLCFGLFLVMGLGLGAYYILKRS